MKKIYLALKRENNHWSLDSYNSFKEVLQILKEGGNFGNDWKILKELDNEIEE